MQSQSAPQNDSPYKNHEQQFQCEQEEQDNYQLNVIPTLNSQSSEFSQPPMLIYSYSGISNASSTPQLTLHSSRVSEQPSHFLFIRAQKLYNSLQKMVMEIKETFMLEDDIILYLMHLHKWNKDRLNENYYDKSQVYMNLNKMLKQNKSKQLKLEGICPVCQTKNQLIQSLLCEHAYCQNCWKNYIKGKLSQNCIFFCCMNRCINSPILLHNFVEKLFPELFELYRKMVCINYAIVNTSISFCPSKKSQCDLFCQRTQVLFDSSVECQCGQFYCFFCREEPHYPATCQDVKKWNKILNSQQGNTKWIQQNTKTCPSCKNPVQKFIGCSKIKCVCGSQFCYECNAKWDQAHKSVKGQCLQMIKKTSLEQRAAGTTFFKLLQQTISIGRTQKKHMSTINSVFEYFKQEGLSFKFHGIRKQVADAWSVYKWSSISTFLYKKPEVDNFLQQQFIRSISRLMQPIERLSNVHILMYSKQLIAMGDQVLSRRQALKRSKDIWLQAWRSS